MQTQISSGISNDIINKRRELFIKWCNENGHRKPVPSLVVHAYNEASKYCIERKISKCDFWVIEDARTFNSIRIKLVENRLFRLKYTETARMIDKTWKVFISYLEYANRNMPLVTPEEPKEVSSVKSADDITKSIDILPNWIKFDGENFNQFERTYPAFCYVNGHVIDGNSWAAVVVEIVENEIAAHNPLCKKLYTVSLMKNREDRPFFFAERIEGQNCAKLSNGYWVNLNYSIPRLIKLIVLLFSFFGYSKDSILLFGVPKQQDQVMLLTPSVTKGNTSKLDTNYFRTNSDEELGDKYPNLYIKILSFLKDNYPTCFTANELDRKLDRPCRMSTLVNILSNSSCIQCEKWKYRYIPFQPEDRMTTVIRRGDNLLSKIDLLKREFPEFVFTNLNAKNEVVERAFYVYPQGMERRGNVLFEIWHLSTEGSFDLYMKRFLLTDAEYQESLETWDKTNESRGRITRGWHFYEELIEYLKLKLCIARNNANQSTISSNMNNKNSTRYPYYEQVSAVLRENYPYGFRLESTIDLKRFRRYAESQEMELPESDDALKAEIKNAGVKIEDKVYLIEADTFDYIKNIIDTLSSDGSTVLFYDCIYDSDVTGMEEHHITSADFLKAIMKQCRQNIFDDLTNIYFAKNFLSLIGDKMERDAVTLEMQRVWGDSQTRVVSEISEQLPMIPGEYVKRYLSGSTAFVWASDGVYFSMQHFIITEAEENAIVDFVAEECNSKGYASISDVPLGNTAEENYELTDFGLQEAIYNKALVGKYRLNGKILTRENDANLDVVALAKQYLIGKEECTFDEMDKKVSEYAGTRYRYMAYEALYSSMVRVDKERYVAHQYVKFDVDAIDEVLSTMISDRFVAIKEITSFALFPLCGLPWNHYLLESYCYSYSKKFCLKVIGFNDKNAGIIAENDVTDNYNELLAQAAARAKIELSAETVGQYYFETGYMGKRKFSDLESIVKRAKAIREGL